MSTRRRVVVCGGGAGGIELVTRLARRRDVDVTLVDQAETHFWKPLLHEVASGSLDAASHEVSYLALARWHGFAFCYGPLTGLDRTSRQVLVGAVADENGTLLIPPRRLSYDLLVLAVGGVTNDFSIAGVRNHALFLDSLAEATEIHTRVARACIAANYAPDETRPQHIRIAIVGGGATGVELAAELSSTTRMLLSYGLDRLDPDHFISITLVNADPRLLMQLPQELAADVGASLQGLGITVRNGEAVVAVTCDGLRTRSETTIPADVVVWTAGVRAPAFLQDLDGLVTNKLGQIVVRPDLRTTTDTRVLAIGDCAACPWLDHGGLVPARAQASHQQAAYLAHHLPALLGGGELPPFNYRDLGSLVSLGPQGSAIGALMGFITGRSYRIGGYLAGVFYRWLYRRHRAVLFGWLAASIESLGLWIGGVTRPKIKLH